MLDVPPDIPTSSLLDLIMSYYSAHVKVTESNSTKIAIETVGQGADTSNMFWNEERRKCLTVSNVGKIAKRQATIRCVVCAGTVEQEISRKCGY